MDMHNSQELMELYKSGELKDTAQYALSAWTGYMIVETDGEQVFGFFYISKFEELERTFFNSEVFYGDDEELGAYFYDKGDRVYLNDFIRV